MREEVKDEEHHLGQHRITAPQNGFGALPIQRVGMDQA